MKARIRMPWLLSPSARECELQGLTANTEYNFCTRFESVSGKASPFSKYVVVKTPKGSGEGASKKGKSGKGKNGGGEPGVPLLSKKAMKKQRKRAAEEKGRISLLQFLIFCASFLYLRVREPNTEKR